MSAITGFLLEAAEGHSSHGCMDPTCSMETVAYRRDDPLSMSQWSIAWARVESEIACGAIAPGGVLSVLDLRDAAQVEALVSGACQ